MTLLKKSALAAVVVLSTFAMGSASAITISAPGVNSPNLEVSINNGVATLFGNAESGIELKLAERELEKTEGVNRVINIATFN